MKLPPLLKAIDAANYAAPAPPLTSVVVATFAAKAALI